MGSLTAVCPGSFLRGISGGASIPGVVVRRLAIAIVALTLAVSPGPALGAEPPAGNPVDQIDWGGTPEYRLVPGDELSLDFGPGEDFTGDVVRAVVVRPDGRITVYPVGDVVAAGHTPVELQAEITRLLAGELKLPRVTVEVTKTAANRVHVLGRVKRPGSQPVGLLPTLLQVISEAGGFEDDAARNSVIIMRRVGLSRVSVERVRVDRLLRGGGDVPLGRYDIVYVPRSSIGNVDVFVDQFFTRILPVGSTVMQGWELFNLEKVFQYGRVVR
jgi:protein involved in polysaccharide export with SLBB domain